MAVGGRVLRTLEARRPPCPDRILRDDYDSRFFAALSALSGKAALGSRRHCPWCSGFGSLMGRAAADVHLYFGQPSSMAARSWRASPPAALLDTTAVSPLAKPARRICARPRAVGGLRRRPDDRDCPRRHTLAAGAAYAPESAAALAGLFGTRASQPQRRSPLSVSVRYFTLVRDAVAHRRVALARFPCRPLSPVFAAMAAPSDRSRQFPLAPQGTRDRAPHPCFFRRSGRRPPHSNFRFAGDTGDRRGPPGGFPCLEKRDTWGTRVFALPAIFQRGGSYSDRCICLGEMGEPGPQPGCPRGREVSPKSGSVPARRQPSKSSSPTPKTFRLLRLGRLCDLEPLSRISRVRGRPCRPLWR